MNPTSPTGERTYRGLAAAGGVIHAKVLVLGQGGATIPSYELGESAVSAEMERLHGALVETRQELQAIQRKVSVAMGSKEADIFDAHLLVLDDPTLLEEVTRRITEQRMNAEAAFHEVAGKYSAALAAVDDAYLAERAGDVRDVEQRVINNLLGVASASDLSGLTEPVIVVAPDLSPSTTATLDRNKVLGFATDGGGTTSHTAIMARKLRIPAVVGLGEITRHLRSGDYALLDGHGGALIVNPTDATLFQYGQIRERRAVFEQRLRDLRDLPAVTMDGSKLILAANIDDPADAAAVKEAGAEGVGLYRTEFLFLKATEPPDEECQFNAYREAAAALAPAAVVIRTLDLGGDKLPGEMGHREENPFLGWRAVRISLDQPDVFKLQLRAILRASAFGHVKLMYPMISSLDELLAANQILDECRVELRAAGIAFDEKMEVGMMIEVPSAALIAPALAPHVNFFSFGTNDLTQYTLAVDRMNERVAHLHQVTHPGVLRLMQMTIEAARPHGCWVGVCGEAAGDPAVIPLFVGLGVHELSATPAVLPAAKFLLRRLKVQEAAAMSAEALKLATASAAYARSLALARQVAPELFPS